MRPKKKSSQIGCQKSPPLYEAKKSQDILCKKPHIFVQQNRVTQCVTKSRVQCETKQEQEAHQLKFWAKYQKSLNLNKCKNSLS